MTKVKRNQGFNAIDCALGIGNRHKKIIFRIKNKIFEGDRNNLKGIYLTAVKKGHPNFLGWLREGAVLAAPNSKQ